MLWVNTAIGMQGDFNLMTEKKEISGRVLTSKRANLVLTQPANVIRKLCPYRIKVYH